jgi:transposase-like protein
MAGIREERRRGTLEEVADDSRSTAGDGPVLERTVLRLLAAIRGQSGSLETPECPDCRGTSHHRWGSVGESDDQRWRCCACGRTFTAKTGTLLSGLQAPDKLRLVVLDMLAVQPRSCRQLGAALGLDKSTIWSWRQKINRLLLEERGETPPTLVSADVEIVRESRKASREWVNHQRDPIANPAPDRLRWKDYRLHHLPLPRPMTPYLVPVLVGTDQSGDCRAGVPRQGRPNSPGSVPSTAFHGPHVQVPGDGRLATAFRRFIRLFRGPSTRHLAGYVAWFATRVVTGLEDQASERPPAMGWATNKVPDMS